MELPKYTEYRNLSEKIKKQRIENAEQSESQRGPNPQGSHKFSEQNFMNFSLSKGKEIFHLHTYRQKSITNPIAIVIMFHGLNSHIGHGAHIAYNLAQHHITTVGFDYRGFGKSSGEDGYIDNIQQHLNDCYVFTKKIRQIYDNLPIFALGLSMGGMTAYHLSLKDRKIFDGVILMAPALKNSVHGFLVGLAGTLGKLLPGKMRLVKPIYGKASRNPQITDDIKKDPYAFSGRARLSTLTMLVKVMNESPLTFKNYESPFIIFQGGLDKLVNPEVAFQIYDKSKTRPSDKQIWFYENMWHDIWHENQIFEIIDKSISWIYQRIGFQEQQKLNQKGQILMHVPEDGVIIVIGEECSQGLASKIHHLRPKNLSK